MQPLAMVAIMAMLGAGTGSAAVMAADFGHGTPDDVQARNCWTGPADFGYGEGEQVGPVEGNQYRYGCGPDDGEGKQYRYAYGTADDNEGQNGYRYMWMADDDGDGIPNGQDDDWLPPEDGSGYKHGHGKP